MSVRTVSSSGRSEMMTVAEVAEELRVVDRSVRRWIASGEMIAHRFGRAIRISRNDLVAFKAARRSDSMY